MSQGFQPSAGEVAIGESREGEKAGDFTNQVPGEAEGGGKL